MKKAIRIDKSEFVPVDYGKKNIVIFDYAFIEISYYKYFFFLPYLMEENTNRLIIREGNRIVPLEAHHVPIVFDITESYATRIIRDFHISNILCTVQFWTHSEYYVNPKIMVKGKHVSLFLHDLFEEKTISNFTRKIVKYKTGRLNYNKEVVLSKKDIEKYKNNAFITDEKLKELSSCKHRTSDYDKYTKEKRRKKKAEMKKLLGKNKK